jgi:hypothetical protein
MTRGLLMVAAGFATAAIGVVVATLDPVAKVGSVRDASSNIEAAANPAAADFKFKFATSEKVKSTPADSDALGWMELNSADASGTKVLTLHGNAATSLDLKNDDASGAITGISGTYSLPSGTTVSNVRLFDPRNDYVELTNVTKSIGSSSFSVSSMSLAAGRTLAVVFEFSNTPAGASTLELSATY